MASVLKFVHVEISLQSLLTVKTINVNRSRLVRKVQSAILTYHAERTIRGRREICLEIAYSDQQGDIGANISCDEGRPSTSRLYRSPNQIF